jgi:ATP-dependent Lon protease
MSLGGVRDEAEIRGHRRTYIGSMPGKVIQSMKKAKTPTRSSCSTRSTRWAGLPRRSVGGAARGARPGAELDVQRPLSRGRLRPVDVMFVTTANTLNMPQPLMDRMEIIRIAGYTEDEKVEIAKRHLICPSRSRTTA